MPNIAKPPHRIGLVIKHDMIGVWDLVAGGYSIHFPGRTGHRGVVGPSVPCRKLSDPVMGQGLMVWAGSQESTSGSRMVLYGSAYRSYTDTG